jgi:hypothetical protein
MIFFCSSALRRRQLTQLKSRIFYDSVYLAHSKKKIFLTFLCHGKIFTIFYLLEILNCKHQSRFFDDKKMNHIFVVELGDKNLLFCLDGWTEFREVDGKLAKMSHQ